MAQFNYMNDIKDICTMDNDLTKGPTPRWQQKKADMSSASINLSNVASKSKLSLSSYNNSFSVLSVSMSKTPRKTDNKGRKTPSGKTPGRRSPISNDASRTPGGDRFIPSRSATNFELGHYLVRQEQQQQNSDEENDGPTNLQKNQSKQDRQRLISETLDLGDIKQKRVLSYQHKAPAAPESHQNPLRVVYSIKTPISSKGGTRYIPPNSERILDAPDIINDYYLNLMDWSTDNVITVALGTSVYLWNAGSGKIEKLVDFEEGDYACSLAWIQEGHILAMGNNEGTVELWDCSKLKRIRVMPGHAARVGSLAWNSYVISSGSRDGKIIHHDVRQREHAVATLSGHTQEVCGLKWSSDAKYLASGGNDNLVNIWPSIISGSSSNVTEPLYVLNQHQAAVRALAWSPWNANILASGGGTADRCIKFWNAHNGQLIDSVDTKSQVCALLWSNTYKEIMSAHGYANNQLTIWKYPSMAKQADLIGHTSRVLQIALSPDGSTVVSAGADETLRLWKCFVPDASTTKKAKAASKTSSSVFKQNIR